MKKEGKRDSSERRPPLGTRNSPVVVARAVFDFTGKAGVAARCQTLNKAYLAIGLKRISKLGPNPNVTGPQPPLQLRPSAERSSRCRYSLRPSFLPPSLLFLFPPESATKIRIELASAVASLLGAATRRTDGRASPPPSECMLG